MATPVRASPSAAAPIQGSPAQGASTGWVTGPTQTVPSTGPIAPGTQAAPPPEMVGGRAVPIDQEDVEKAKTRGITPQQSAILDSRLAEAEAVSAYYSQRGVALDNSSTAGRAAREKIKLAMGSEPWVAQAMAKEMYATAPVPAGPDAPPGVTARAADGSTVVFPYPSAWPDSARVGWEETTALENGWRAGGGDYVPRPEVLPAGYSVKSAEQGWVGGLMDYLPGASNIRGAVNGDASRALGGPIDKLSEDLTGKGLDELPGAIWDKLSGAVPNADLSGFDRFGGSGGVGSGGATGAPATPRDFERVQFRGPTGVETMTPAQIAAIERVAAGEMRAAQISPTTQTRVAGIASSTDATADLIRAARIDPVARAQYDRVSGETLNPTERAEYERVTGTTIDRAALANAAQIRRDEQAEMRSRQLAVLQQLEDAAAGRAPSVAQLMLQRQTEENIAQQRGLAAQARGTQVGLASMNAATNVGFLNQRAALDQALLRAQEMSTARGQLGQATDSVRGQDIGLETSQAGLAQQTALANQGAVNTRALSQAQLIQQAALANQSTGAQTSQFNAGQGNQASQTQAQLNQQANLANQSTGAQVSQFNAGQINTRSTQQAQLTQDAAKANQSAATQVSLANAQQRNAIAIRTAELAQQAYLADASADNLRKLEQAKLEQQSAAQNLQTATQVDLANAAAANQRNEAQAGLTQDAGKFNAAATNTRNLADTQTQRDIDLANQNAGLTSRGIDDTRDASLRGDDIARRGQDIDIEKTKVQSQWEMAKTKAALTGGLIETGGALAGVALSDERAKTSIKLADTDIAGFLDALSRTQNKSWRYKDPGDPRAGEGRRYGKMAQDLERSAVGRTFVRGDDDGTKVIDVKNAIGPMLAAIAQVNSRLSKLEKRRRG